MPSDRRVDNRVQFRLALDPGLPAHDGIRARTQFDDETTVRTSATHTVLRDLERYYDLLRASLPALTEAEASLVMDATKSTYLDVTAIRLLWATVEEADADEGLGAKWGVDAAGLVERIRDWDVVRRYAVVDAIERVWLLTASGESREAALRSVGLVR